MLGTQKFLAMKFVSVLFSLGALMLGFTTLSVAQEVLPEVKIVAVNYKYLNAVDHAEVAVPVQQLEREAASFDPKEAKFYEDEYDNYFVSFYIPEGKILAAYDKEGNLLRTAEKYKDIKLPAEVIKSVAQKYPKWKIYKDVYLVNYHEAKGITKQYKLLLVNGDKRLKVKTNEKGEFL